MRNLFAIAAIALAAASAQADVKLPAIISDNMCLQANKTLPIWGKAEPNEQVTVTLGDDKETAVAGPDGKWMMKLHALPPGTGPLEMKVAGKNTIEVKNIIVGEVWVASGQSNMEFNFSSAHNAEEERPKANYPKIRLFTVKRAVAFEPNWDCEGKWVECTPETVGGTSAVGYFFARDIHEKLGVPVGLIHTSWGGTGAQLWTSVEALLSNPQTEAWGKSVEETKKKLPALRVKYEKELLPKWEEADKKWKETYPNATVEKRRVPPEPRQPTPPENIPGPANLFDGMIAPLIPFGIEGAIWYQGESNAGRPGDPSASQYATLFPEMITDWRTRWTAANPDEKDFPFCFVQLANYMQRQSEPVQEAGGWPGLREAQHMTLKLPNTGEAVIIDIGQADNIHPKDKMDVGKRLALAALKVAYHKDGVFSGPTYESLAVEGNRAIVKFDNIGSGLTIAAGPSTQPRVPAAQPASALKGFSIAGEDKKFVWADAKIEGNRVVVWNDQVSKPVAVRYAWANNPECNLYNKEGLPASPFRTDTWVGPAPVSKR
jgi:sialate O-acetylesterase